LDFNSIKKQEAQESSKKTQNFVSSNPIDNPRIMPLNTRTSSNRLYSGYNGSSLKNIDNNSLEMISIINEIFMSSNDAMHLFYEIHNKICPKFNLSFTALGLCNSDSNYINLKLIDKTCSSYNSKIMLNDLANPIVSAFVNKQIVSVLENNFIKMSHFTNAPVLIIPLLSCGEVMGIMAFCGANVSQNIEILKTVSNFYSLFYQNCRLLELVNQNTDIDLLTGLYNHKKLQEGLAFEITNCMNKNSDLAFCIFDIANISDINKELGHAKGDLVIKEVAQKLKKNIRNTDVIGRYGGDEVAIVMPNVSEEEAKYFCEYLLYNLSCTLFDDLGQVKFSCGISMFPKTTNKQEKLTILAEQALYIAKSKRNSSGQSEIVTTSDFNFWDDEALKCFAQVLTKKHASIGVNIEEELINQFHDEDIISNEHLLDVVSSLANAIDAKDTYTKGHSAAVSRYSEALARAINLPANEVERIKLGAMLHDIGKIGIPEQVLKKPTALNEDEWNIMKQHPSIGSDKVLQPNKALHDLIPMVKFHHEHIDGTGYPYGLKGDDIPLSARIVAVADAFHALISDRPYRKGMSINKACEILKMGAGIQWDRDLVREFIIIAPSLAVNY